MGMMALLAFSLTALGFCIAWRMSSTQGFHAIMNLFLMPMWFLSGALFPAAGAAGVIRWVMRANPLTYGLDGLRRCLYHADPAVAGREPAMWVCLDGQRGRGGRPVHAGRRDRPPPRLGRPAVIPDLL